MTAYDAAMAGVIVAGMVWGAIRGVTWQIASILSLVLGYCVAQPLSTQLAPHFPGEPVVARALAMIAVYFAVSGGVFVAAWLIRATLRRFKFESFDRHLGMLLGGLEGALLGLVVTLFVLSLAPSSRDPIFQSPSGKVVGVVMSTLGPILPAEAQKVLAPFFRGDTESTVEETETPAIAMPPRLARRPDPRPEPEPARLQEPTQPPAPRTASRARVAQPPAPASSRDKETSPASFRDFLDESQRRIGRAVIEGATEGLKRAAEGEVPVERPRNAPRR